MQQRRDIIEYVINNDKVKEFYSINYDKKKLTELLDKIVKTASYRVKGSFSLPEKADYDYKNNRIISGANLPNGDLMFEEVERLYLYSGPYSAHDDLVGVRGTKVTAPILAYIIKDILDKKTIL